MPGDFREQGILLILRLNRRKTILVIFTTGELIELVLKPQIM